MPGEATFKIFRGFNDGALQWAARSNWRLDERTVRHFTGDRLVERICGALAKRQAITVKETLESFETFARTRRRLRAPRMADLCCGHGLTGLLFAAVERGVEQVTLLDREKPPKGDLVVEAAIEAAPWVAQKVRWLEADVGAAPVKLDRGTSVIAVHACGDRTDRVIDAAIALDGNLAVLPCCYPPRRPEAPRALWSALGGELASDVHRTYRLEAAGFHVQWSYIPSAISPKNRVLVATRRR